MLRAIDYLLDRITMYRLVLYCLIVLVGIAFVLSLFGVVRISPLGLLASSLFFTAVCWVANKTLARIWNVPTNVESVYITALILSLIFIPAETVSQFVLLFWVALLAMASKYILNINKKHVFNPAAVAAVITGFAVSQPADWWVGTAWMAPFVAICGFLIIRKLRFSDLAWGFFATVLIVSLGFSVVRRDNIIMTLDQLALHSSFLFLGSIMLTEPLTMPPTKRLQMIYGVLVGFLSVPQVHLGGIFLTPEEALSIGNVFAYIVSPKTKLLLTLKDKITVSADVMDFVFKPHKRFSFVPGQYMEWTLQHPKTDSRGNRRYFTLASSPTEETVRLGVRFYERGSSFKNALRGLDSSNQIVADRIAGDFTLPNNKKEKLVFLAGGIGITPFRSMIKYLVDKKEQRDIVLLYSNKTADEIVYKDVFSSAREIGLKTYYTLTATSQIPENWSGKVGRIDHEMIRETVPDFMERTFYLSGPQAMVKAFEETLKGMNVRNEQIKKDFFPGFA